MAAITALIFVGYPHPNDGGLRPLVTIQYSEGDRPAFTFPRHTGERRDTSSRFVLIPSLENMLDDLLMIIAYREIQDPNVVKCLNCFCNENVEQIGRLKVYEELTPDQRTEIYEHVKKITCFPKVGICLFKGSELLNTVDHIKEYKMEYEVCTPSLTSNTSSF
jgi:hypothetical protein